MTIANTTIQIKKSGTTGNKPTSLNYGELALNYYDGKLFYKDSSGNISHFYGANNGPSFATANANNNLILASTPNDTLSLNAANGISITACTTTKTITIGDGTTYSLASSAALYANGAFIQANAAFDAANSGSTPAFAFAQANAAFIQANAAFEAANSGSTPAYAFTQANAAYAQANTATTNAAAASSYANSAFTQANTATTNAAAASSYANSAFSKANSAVITTKEEGTTLTSSTTSLNFTGSVNLTNTGGDVTIQIGPPRVVTIADGTSVTMNGDTTDIAVQTNTQSAGTLTINAITGTLINGQKIIFRLKSSSIQTFSWNAVFSGSSDLALPSSSTGSDKYDYMGFIYNSDATKWQIIAKNFGF